MLSLHHRTPRADVFELNCAILTLATFIQRAPDVTPPLSLLFVAENTTLKRKMEGYAAFECEPDWEMTEPGKLINQSAFKTF